MAAIDRVRVMVLGDSGVGKTSFVHLAANNEPVRAPGWTIGCSVEVKLHEYKEGTPGQVTYFIELWDVGGSEIIVTRDMSSTTLVTVLSSFMI
ncbi:drab5-related [Holotrichia oblita]|uniref:Drab5-related n=1 Tax=Holotrichia oblita TaxID=644536 RepID=A0ACB9TJI2_HOLOL|nr:drab5-related [Holotrichia oblita]